MSLLRSHIGTRSNAGGLWIEEVHVRLTPTPCPASILRALTKPATLKLRLWLPRTIGVLLLTAMYFSRS